MYINYIQYHKVFRKKNEKKNRKGGKSSEPP